MNEWLRTLVSRPVGISNDAPTFSCGHSSLQDLHLWQERGWEDCSGCTTGRHQYSQHALWNTRYIPASHQQGRLSLWFGDWRWMGSSVFKVLRQRWCIGQRNWEKVEKYSSSVCSCGTVEKTHCVDLTISFRYVSVIFQHKNWIRKSRFC